jgi:putative ABC transport system substrate-binding protein
MRRRDFIKSIGGAAAWPVMARAQQPAMPVIGFLNGSSPATNADYLRAFRQSLKDTGFVEGHNVVIEYRWAEGHLDRLPAMATDLVSRRVAVIFVTPDVGVQAAMAATKTIPIVFTTASDPVAAGFVSSLGRPGGNVTGIAFMGIELVAKRVELLRQLLPDATRIAVLVNPNNPGIMQNVIQHSQIAARRLGLEIVVIEAGTESEIDRSIMTAAQQRAAALIIGNDAWLGARRRQIAFLALRYALPTMANTRDNVDAGILMSYGTNQVDSTRQAGVYVGRILKGDKPADLPVLQPTRFELVINLTTAKALGLKIPEAFLLRADEVIE